ncbi:glycosyltransferase sugar-binding region containing DXD motif protein [Caedimonas varicaedens]|uniref:Glycosyltransferase sugar-binding region containing DXD motif protein n=1 Tax=Caedimonas varicaedens TaxID=1629334 RepID=A0A0K8MEA3_9PROT|nr:glycosyltransferase sugar-binding region containing DXD motif protein [Caedimonas varicaedens]
MKNFNIKAIFIVFLHINFSNSSFSSQFNLPLEEEELINIYNINNSRETIRLMEKQKLSGVLKFINTFDDTEVKLKLSFSGASNKRVTEERVFLPKSKLLWNIPPHYYLNRIEILKPPSDVVKCSFDSQTHEIVFGQCGLAFPTHLDPFDFSPKLFKPSPSIKMKAFHPESGGAVPEFLLYPTFPKEFDGHLHYLIQTALLGEEISDGKDFFEQRNRLYTENNLEKLFFLNRYVDEEIPYKIPQIFHTIWVTSLIEPIEVPTEYLQWAEHAVKSNPLSEGWKHFLWIKNRDLLPHTVKYLEENNSPLQIKSYDELDLSPRDAEILAQYIRECKMGKSSDFLRYLILEKIGGVYKDTDYIVEQSCTVLNKVYDFYAGVEPMSAFIGNALIAAKPHHPILQYTLQMIVRNHEGKAPAYIKTIPSKSGFKTILETGPSIFSVAFYKTAGQDENIDVVFPPMMLYPTPIPSYPQKTVVKLNDSIPPSALGAHLWQTSWFNPKYKSIG